jgi:hypothetical protein
LWNSHSRTNANQAQVHQQLPTGLKLPRKIETTTGGAPEFGTSAFQAGNFFRSLNALFGENAFSASNGLNLTRRI